MKKRDYIRLSNQVSLIEEEFNILDPSNSFENKRIALLKRRLEMMLNEINTLNKKERLDKFKLIKSEK